MEATEKLSEAFEKLARTAERVKRENEAYEKFVEEMKNLLVYLLQDLEAARNGK